MAKKYDNDIQVQFHVHWPLFSFFLSFFSFILATQKSTKKSKIIVYTRYFVTNVINSLQHLSFKKKDAEFILNLLHFLLLFTSYLLNFIRTIYIRLIYIEKRCCTLCSV